MLSFFRKFAPSPVIGLYHFLIALVGAVLYRFPSRKLIVIGITGTHGKSTVVYVLTTILEAAGKKIAATSSIEFQIGEKRWPNMYKMTMPGRFFMQRFLRRALNAGCSHAVIEVTSEGLLQHRHRFIDWDMAMFLNLAPEHIERHGSYERYRAAKGELFAALKIKNKKSKIKITDQNSKLSKTIIVNLADREAGYFLRFPAVRYVGFRFSDQQTKTTLPNGGQEILAHNLRSDNGISFCIDGHEVHSLLQGSFNAENILAAAACAILLDVELQMITRAIKSLDKIPGRMEEIHNDLGIRIIVDYAHTPTALKDIYKTLKSTMQPRAISPKPRGGFQPATSRMICVLGAAGGGRDKWKRPEFGRIAAKYCDCIILTNEDPYDENPLVIIGQIENGFPQSQELKSAPPHYEKILDRGEAIKKAIEMARPSDVVVITGKGCELWMAVGRGEKISWDDREVVRGILRPKTAGTETAR